MLHYYLWELLREDFSQALLALSVQTEAHTGLAFQELNVAPLITRFRMTETLGRRNC